MSDVGNNYTTYISDDESFLISIPKKDGNEILYTSSNEFESDFDSVANRLIMSSIKDYQKDTMYSVRPQDDISDDNLTPEDIDRLAVGIQSNLANVRKVNEIIRNYIIIDDIIGKTQEAIETNVNTEIKLSYNDFSNQRNKNKQLETAKAIVNKFNKQIRLKHLIKECIPITFAEGNCIYCLRTNEDKSEYSVDRYPLGIAIVSDYNLNGNPIIEIDINELQNRLKKIYKKDKNNNALYFKNIEEDIKNNYPIEVYNAYKNKERYVRLDTKTTKIIRINNLGRKYGISPIFKALKPALMLKTYENSDYINTKAKAKKIIFQKMRKEAMGKDYLKTGIQYTIKAHTDLMDAWKNKTVVYTAIPQVESLEYVEPNVDETNADKINAYRSKEMTTLGIGFIDSNVANFSVAKISLEQLMKTINSISEQLEEVIQSWYSVLFENEGIDTMFLPDIQILDTEVMDIELKKELAKLIYTTFNGSLETSLGLLGINANDEKAKRQRENELGYDDVFIPRQTSYTVTKDGSETGRPPDSENEDKQEYDANHRN